MFHRRQVHVACLALAGLFTSTAESADPTLPNTDPKSDGKVIQAKQVADQPPGSAPVAPGGTEQAPAAAPVTPAAASSTAPSAAPALPSGPTPQTGLTAGNIAAQGSGDLGNILNNSPAVTGVDVQRRNAIIADPRVRGYRTGQLVNYGDGGFFFPARLDLDTAISKFDPGLVRDINIIKGPYSVRYGPGFAFLDIVTFDSPRATNGCDWELHGRSFLGYQTNGQRWNGLQEVEYGARDWGFRATYNVLAGNDYNAPGYQRNDFLNTVPGSYNSQNFSFALGFDLSRNTSVEFKALRVFQNDIEFPGLYFDLDNLDTAAYSLRLKIKDQPYFDLLTTDLWYNTTVADGNTVQGYKQAFLSGNPSFPIPPGGAPNDPRRIGFLAGPGGFNLPFDPRIQNFPGLTDFSTTRISESSEGFRSRMMWGREKELNVSVGTDFTRVAQGQQEGIRIRDPNNLIPKDPNNPFPGDPTVAFQNLGLPNSQLINPGLFLDGDLPFSDRLTFHGGARVDYVRTQAGTRSITGNIFLFGAPQVLPPFTRETNLSEADLLANFSVSNNPETSRDWGLWSTYLTSDYKFDDCLTGLMGVGYAMRPPTLTELYSDGPLVGVLQPGINRLIGDPRLDPEKLLQFDVGLRGDYGWLKGSINGFYAWINDYITYDLNKAQPGSITQVIFTNTDRATLAGGELYVQTEATSWLTPYGNISYVQGRDLTHRDFRRPVNTQSSRRDSGTETEPLPGIPPMEFRYGFRVHESIEPQQNPRWSVELALRSVMDQGLFAESLGEQPTPGFTIVDIRTYWQVTPALLVNAGVENVGNKLYREHLDPRAGNLLFRPGTNFYFSTQYRY
jgi:outer membrane receptor protein involved in Fe transport